MSHHEELDGHHPIPEAHGDELGHDGHHHGEDIGDHDHEEMARVMETLENVNSPSTLEHLIDVSKQMGANALKTFYWHY